MSENRQKTFFLGVLVALSLAHGLNDAIQSLISAIYPMLKSNLALTYGEIGLVALMYQISSSIMQPIFGYLFDRRPAGWFLPMGLCCTMGGILLIAFTESFEGLLCAVFVSGIGSSIMHPEASRITSIAAGNKKGLAQSIFQVGGTCGFAAGPLLAALFVREQPAVAKFSILAVVAMFVLIPACRWYSERIRIEKTIAQSQGGPEGVRPGRPRGGGYSDGQARDELSRYHPRMCRRL